MFRYCDADGVDRIVACARCIPRRAGALRLAVCSANVVGGVAVSRYAGELVFCFGWHVTRSWFRRAKLGTGLDYCGGTDGIEVLLGSAPTGPKPLSNAAGHDRRTIFSTDWRILICSCRAWPRTWAAHRQRQSNVP